jgi:endoglucanase Acf2
MALACASQPAAPPTGAPSFAGIAREAVGAGAILARLPDGERGPSDKRGMPVRPKVAPGWQGAPPTNDWWSSLIWQYDADAPYGQPLYAHPLVLQPEAGGLGVGYPTSAAIDERSYLFRYRRDLLIGLEGLAARDARAARASDWVVTALIADQRRALHATFGHGLPFVYCEGQGGPAVVELGEGARIWSEARTTIGVTVDGHSYGLFLPAGGSWTRAGRRLTADLSRARGAFSVAALPEESAATLALFHRHAFAFVTDSRVSWRYDQPSATVITTFALTTEARDGEAVPLVALYPHQWLHTAAPAGPLTYLSPRGPMKLLAVSSFETRLPFGGVLPVLPTTAGPDAGTLRSAIKAVYKGSELFPIGPEGTRGTYWTGKALEKLALLVWLADQIGYGDARDGLVRALEGELERWFDGRPPEAFAYEPTWHTLVGVPQEYRSGWELNDHHFHYGYFVFAAATVARFDPGWAARDRWGAMVDLLIADAASADRKQTRFPFLRHFDPYAGHSWASGAALFREGNNEESSSEDVNFAVAALLWGALTGDTATRDLGIFLYAQTTTAIEQYWFDVDRRAFPRAFDKPAVAMVWGAGGKYDTWWDHNPIYVHGINFLPFTGGSLYLGRRPEYVRENHRRLVAANRGEVRLWRDLIWMYLALADPGQAAALYDANHYFDPEIGDSQAFLYHWIFSLRALGQVDPAITADVPTYAVFRNGSVRTHAALNPGREPRRVTFSDGAILEVPAGAMRTVEGNAPMVTHK